MSTGTRPYGDCWSTLCCLAVWYIWVESSTALGGFRVLKKTSEAPYTTKLNYRDRTSRGSTREVFFCVYRLRSVLVLMLNMLMFYLTPEYTSLLIFRSPCPRFLTKSTMAPECFARWLPLKPSGCCRSPSPITSNIRAIVGLHVSHVRAGKAQPAAAVAISQPRQSESIRHPARLAFPLALALTLGHVIIGHVLVITWR